MKSVFWILVLALIFYIGFQIVPIYYKGVFGIRGICKENADVYHKYDRSYIHRTIDETLRDSGIPRNKSKFNIRVTDDKVIIWIYYRDTANFMDYYKKDFEFTYECEGVLDSVYN